MSDTAAHLVDRMLPAVKGQQADLSSPNRDPHLGEGEATPTACPRTPKSGADWPQRTFAIRRKSPLFGYLRGWQDNVVQGKTEMDPARVALLLQQIQQDAVECPADLAPAFQPLQLDARNFALQQVVLREGQGAFRLRLLDAYGRCAISGERTEPVLDAARIQPYLGAASNHVQNGLLLTKEFHALFDKGYVTVTPDYEVRVSRALREDWRNGKRYSDFDRQKLRVVPQIENLKPGRDALAGHQETLFLG